MQNTNHAKSKALEYIYIYKIKLKKIIKVDPCPSDIQSWTWTTTQVNSNQPFYYNNTLMYDCNLTNDAVCHVVQMYVLLLFIYLFIFAK